MAEQHRGEEFKGRAKEAAGALTDDSELKREGQNDQTSAKIKRGIDEAAEKVTDKAEEFVDKVRGNDS